MGWETRGNRRYYYRKHRQADGTVVSEYMGSGDTGALFADVLGARRHEHTMERLALRDVQATQRRIDQAIEQYRRKVRGALADALRALGFHQHKGQWRLQRGEKAMTNEAKEYFELVKAAGSKKPGPALARLREYVREHPDLFDNVSTLARTTLAEVVNSCTDSEAMRIHMEGEADALRRRLGVDQATPLERLLIDDVVICWVRMQVIEQGYSQVLSSSITFAKGVFWERRLTATRRRYLQSIESLARVRGLLSRIGVQVNIAQQQIVNR